MDALDIKLILFGCLIFLTGCVGTVMEGAHITNDTTTRDKYMTAALAGDTDAQYRVGKSYCCAPKNDVDAFYNNRKATEFLCKAARKHHAKAAFELGKIYSDDTIDGVRLIRRAVTAVRGDNLESRTVAYYWFDQANLYGHPDALDAMNDLGIQDISTFTDPETTPCTLSEVFGDHNIQ